MQHELIEELAALARHVESLLNNSTALRSAMELEHNFDGEAWAVGACNHLANIEKLSHKQLDAQESKVVSLVGDTVGNPFDNSEIADRLRELTEKTKTGEITALAYAVVTQDTAIATGWAGVHGTVYSLAAGIAQLDFRYKVGISERG